MRRALVLLVFILAAEAAVAAETPSSALAGRPLAEALSLLQAQGLAIVFSSELVRPDDAGRAGAALPHPARALDEILAPHGLAVRPGPGGRLLVVSAPLSSPPAPAPAPSAAPPERIQFEEKVEVPGHSDEALRHSATEVSPAQVTATAGGLENVFHTLQLLPGVTALQEFGGRLAVRGGGPDENLTVLDGVEVHNPFRLFGLTSAFNPETIERFELSTGAFSARHGDRLSSLLVIDSRDGSAARRLQGAASLGLTDSNVVLEGRLPGKRRGSWLATARRTYYDLFAERFFNANFPDFADLQVRAAWEPRARAEADDPGTAQPGGNGRERRRARPRRRGGFRHPRGHEHQPRLRDLGRDDRRPRAQPQHPVRLRPRRHFRRRGPGPCRDAALERAGGHARRAIGLDFERTVGVRDIALRQEFFGTVSRHWLNTGLELHQIRQPLGREGRRHRSGVALGRAAAVGRLPAPASRPRSTRHWRARGWAAGSKTAWASARDGRSCPACASTT